MIVHLDYTYGNLLFQMTNGLDQLYRF
jgi:hypothetical protein